MSGSFYTLNSKYNTLQAEIAKIISGGGGGGVPTSSNLADVLLNGNSAGATDIDMNNNDILNCNNLDVVTINGNPVGGGTLEDVLTAGNVADLNINIVDGLVTPTQSVQISPNSISMICDAGTGSISTSIGNQNVNGTALAGLGAIVNNTASLSLSCGGVGFQPPTGTLTATATPTTSQVNLASGGQFLNAKSVQMDLNGITHFSNDGSENYTIATNGYVNINAGNTPYGFKKTRFNTNATSSAFQAEADNTGIKAYQTSAPTFYAQLQPSEIRTNNGASGSSYMTWTGITTNNSTQTTALQPTQLSSNNDFSITTTTTGDINIFAVDGINLKANNTSGLTQGIFIDKATPSIYYELNTGNPSDRVVLNNAGTLSMINVGASAVTDLSPNSLIIQHPSASTSMDLDSDTGMKFATNSVSNYSYYKPQDCRVVTGASQVQFNGTGLTASGSTGSVFLNTTGSVTSTKTQDGAVNLLLYNTSATAGASNGVPLVQSYAKQGRNAVAGDIIGQHSFFAKDYTGNNIEWCNIQASCRNNAVGNTDGSIALSGLINGVQTEFFRVNGADSENNMFLPLDMNGQSIKSSSTNLTLSATGSSGTGSIIIAPKSATGDLQFDGANIQSATTGGSSGQHLRIKLNGVYYKIALQND